MTDYRGSPYRGHPEDRSLVELLSEGKKDKKGLKQGIAVMKEKREQQNRREKALRQKIESLKRTLYSLKNDSSSIIELQEEIEALNAIKRNPFADDIKEYKREVIPQEKPRRRKKLGTRIERAASVSSVPVNDRKMYVKRASGRTLKEEFEERKAGRTG